MVKDAALKEKQARDELARLLAGRSKISAELSRNQSKQSSRGQSKIERMENSNKGGVEDKSSSQDKNITNYEEYD